MTVPPIHRPPIHPSADYLTKVVVKGKNSSNTKVAEIMTPQDKLVTVTPKHSVLDVMTLMVDKNFRHVPVVSLWGAYLAPAHAVCKFIGWAVGGLSVGWVGGCLGGVDDADGAHTSCTGLWHVLPGG